MKRDNKPDKTIEGIEKFLRNANDYFESMRAQNFIYQRDAKMRTAEIFNINPQSLFYASFEAWVSISRICSAVYDNAWAAYLRGDLPQFDENCLMADIYKAYVKKITSQGGA